MADDFETIHARHFDIQQHDRRHFVFQHFQRFDAIARGTDTIALALQEAGGDLAHGQRIVHHHDQWRQIDAFRFALDFLHRRALGQLERVDDQRDAAIAKHRGAADSGDPRQLRTDILDHRLEVAFHRIDAHRQSLRAGMQQQHRAVTAVARLRLAANQFGQRSQWKLFAIQFEITDIVQGLYLLDLEFAHQRDQRRRQRPGLAAGAGQYNLRQRQSQRQTDGEPRALAGFGLQLDATADAGDLVLDDIEADSAPGDFCDQFGGGETGAEQELFDLVRPDHLTRLQPAARLGLLAHRSQIDAGAVVGKVDDDFIPFLARRQTQLAIFRLADTGALVGHFNPVRNRIAYQVFKRCGDLVEHGAVHFGLPAIDFQLRLAPGFLGGLSHHAVKTLGQGIQRHHADMHEFLLQVSRHARLQQQCVVGFGEAGKEVVLRGGNVVDAFRHQAGEFLQAREAIEFERIEMALIDLRQTRVHLRFGLDFELAQLRTQPIDVGGQFLRGLLVG